MERGPPWHLAMSRCVSRKETWRRGVTGARPAEEKHLLIFEIGRIIQWVPLPGSAPGNSGLRGSRPIFVENTA